MRSLSGGKLAAFRDVFVACFPHLAFRLKTLSRLMKPLFHHEKAPCITTSNGLNSPPQSDLIYKMTVHTLLSLNGRAIGLACAKSDRKAVPKRTVQPSFFVMITAGGHDNNISTSRKGKREDGNEHPIRLFGKSIT